METRLDSVELRVSENESQAETSKETFPNATTTTTTTNNVIGVFKSSKSMELQAKLERSFYYILFHALFVTTPTSIQSLMKSSPKR